MRVRAFTQDDAHIFCTEDRSPKSALKSLSWYLISTRTSVLRMWSSSFQIGLKSESGPMRYGIDLKLPLKLRSRLQV